MPTRILSGNVGQVRINCTSSGCFSIAGDKSGDKRESVDGVSAGRVVSCESAGTDCKSVIRRFESDLGLFDFPSGKSHFTPVFPCVSSLPGIAVLTPPDSTELCGNLPFGDKQFSIATETLSVPVAFACVVLVAQI
jgi:hypothetical protein